MIYTLLKDEETYLIDDNKTLAKQTERFINTFNTIKQADIAEFDNAYVLLINERLVITEKQNLEEQNK